jgi:hypothetical protein
MLDAMRRVDGAGVRKVRSVLMFTYTTAIPAARAASSTGRVASAAAAMSLMSTPARSNIPPAAAKSFCASITKTAMRRGST